jgi:hypothetical protein
LICFLRGYSSPQGQFWVPPNTPILGVFQGTPRIPPNTPHPRYRVCCIPSIPHTGYVVYHIPPWYVCIPSLYTLPDTLYLVHTPNIPSPGVPLNIPLFGASLARPGLGARLAPQDQGLSWVPPHRAIFGGIQGYPQIPPYPVSGYQPSTLHVVRMAIPTAATPTVDAHTLIHTQDPTCRMPNIHPQDPRSATGPRGPMAGGPIPPPDPLYIAPPGPPPWEPPNTPYLAHPPGPPAYFPMETPSWPTPSHIALRIGGTPEWAPFWDP